VVIFIDDQSYYTRFHIRAYADMYEEANWFTGWTHSDALMQTGLPEGHQVLIPYDKGDLSLGVSENAISQIYAPQGGSFVKNGTDVKGAIQIKLPVLYTNTMLRFRVEVFNYIADKSFTTIIAGYNHLNSLNWHNCSAQILTSSLDNAHKVYFGDDGTNTIVWIGEPDTEWKYLKVRISEVQASHGNYDVNTWNKGWEIDLDTLSFSSKVKRTVTNTLPVASGSSIWQNTNNDVFYPNPDGKVGIGTNNLSAELTVNGHIHAKEVKVFTEAGADFVFDENYELPDLNELENFVTQNKHLPDIPPEKEMVKDGIHLAEMNVKLLQKVEELTFDMNKRLEALNQDNLQLKKQIKKKN